MKNNLSVQKKVDAALRSVSNIEPAAPSPFFYSKVLARIHDAKITLWEKWSAFFLRPAISFAAICFIIIINAVVLYSKTGNHVLRPDQAEVASSDEYGETVTVLYDLENVKP